MFKNLQKDPRIHYYEITDSTNLQAKLLAESGAPDGTVVIAECQTGGKGRMGRSFYSPADSGIYLSVILRPNCPAAQLMHLTCAAAVCVCDAIEAAASVRPNIKWTNDLILGDKKLGGILTELSLDARGNVTYAIIGVGVNCCQKELDFPEEIRSFATSIAAATCNSPDRENIAAAVINALRSMGDTLLCKKAAFMEQYRRDCITTGKNVSVVRGDEVRYGFAESIDDNGALIVVFSDGHKESVNAGEVSIRGMYGYLN